MPEKLTRAAVGVLSYYAVSLIVVPAVKGWIPGPAGTMCSCFLQMFYVSFLFPWCMKYLYRAKRANTGTCTGRKGPTPEPPDRERPASAFSHRRFPEKGEEKQNE